LPVRGPAEPRARQAATGEGSQARSR
jgi:hypothetical protein